MNKIPPNRTHPPSSRRWLIFALCALLFICSQFYRVSNAIIAPQLQNDLALSSGSLGLLSAVFFYTFALAQIPLGLCLDRFGSRWTMFILTMIGASGAWVFAVAQSFTGATLGRMLLGLGMAGNLMGSLKLFIHWFSPSEFATLSGVMMALGTLGNMLAATPLALVVASMGWRMTFVAIGCCTLILAFLFVSLVRERPQELGNQYNKKGGGPSFFETTRMLLKRRDYWLISFGAFCRYGILVAIHGLWAGPYLMKGLGFSPVTAGNILIFLNIGLIVGYPCGGLLSDRVFHTRKWIVIWGMGAMALVVFVLAMGWGANSPTSSLWALAGTFFLLGASSGIFGMVIYAHFKELMPEEMSGVALTGVNFFTMVGAAVFLQGMGWFLEFWSDTDMPGPGDYQQSFFLGFLGLVIACLLYLFTRQERDDH